MMSAQEPTAQHRAENEARFPDLKGVKTHPFLDIIPLMVEDEFTRLVWSLRRSGLLDPIVLADDCIIDGRCRYIACKLAGIEPRFQQCKFDGDPEGNDEAIKAYIVGVNLLRQNRSRAELCLDDARMAALYPDFPETLVSDEAKLILRYDDLAERVSCFGLSLAEAYDLAREREAAKSAEDHQRLIQLRAEAPFIAALVDEGRLTLDQGLARAEEIAAAPQLAEHAQAIRALGRRMIADTIEMGRRLAECRRLVRRDWIGWLDRELGLSDRSALNFIRVYELAAVRSENFADLNLPVSGLYLLAQPSTPEAVRDDVFQRAAAGETISFADIRRDVSGERPATGDRSGLAEIAAQLAEKHPDDPLVHRLNALVSKGWEREP